MSKAKSKSSVKTSKKAVSNIHAMKDPQAFNKEIEEMIAEAAYYKAEKRNFKNGFDMQDWLEAEREINEGAAKH